MKIPIRFVCLALVVTLLSACAILPKINRQDVYQLPASAIAPHPDSASAVSLRIARPATSGMLRSPRILVMQSPNTLSAFAGARWNSPPAILLRDQLTDAFYNDGRIRNLGSDSDRLPAHYELGGILRTFHLDTTVTPARVEIRVDIRLVDTTSQNIVAMRRFSARTAIEERQPPNVVAAFGQAIDQLAQELIAWTVTQTTSATLP